MWCWLVLATTPTKSSFFCFHVDVLRFGGSAQSHIIFHPSSFFPRSAMLNLTVDVLGASINVLETAARFEGVEILIEQFFGDEGYFPDDRIMKMFNLKPYEERDKEERTVNKVLRRQRSLSIEEDINRVENHLHKLHRTVSLRKSFFKATFFPKRAPFIQIL